MNRVFALVWVALLSFLLVANSHDRPKLTFDGLGEIRIGMSSDAAKKMGFRLAENGPWDEIDDESFIACHYLEQSPRFPGIALMMNDDKVARIDIGYGGDKDWQSYSGAKIGMSESDVKAIYGEWLKISGHPYLGEAGSYLRLDSGNGKYAMIFETAIEDMSGDPEKDSSQEKFVSSFRAGLADAVGFIEGCA